MKNNDDEQNVVTFLDLQATSLSAKQTQQRDKQLTTAAKLFAEAVSADALAARGELVETIFDRLQNEADLSWQEHAQLCIGLCDIRTRDGLHHRLPIERKAEA